MPKGVLAFLLFLNSSATVKNKTLRLRPIAPSSGSAASGGGDGSGATGWVGYEGLVTKHTEK